MLKDILNLEGIVPLSKAQQKSINGGDLEQCSRLVVLYSDNYPAGIYIECWNTETNEFEVYSMLGNKMEGCP